MQCGGGGNSFSPLTPFPCRRRSWRRLVIFAKICSSRLVQWLQSPSWRGGAQRRPLIYLFATRFLVGKKQKSRRIFLLANTFLRKTPLAIFCPALRDTLPKRIKEFENFCSCIFCWQFAILLILHAINFSVGFFNGRLGADPNRFACKTRAAI